MSDEAETLAKELQQAGETVAVAESLTSGAIANALGAAPEASEWFKGGIVAYMNDVKYDLLGVSPGPVVSERCAREMAAGVRERLGADLGVAVTGVGGPGSEEDQPAGTVFVAVAAADSIRGEEHHFDGEPKEVLASTIRAALQLAIEAVRDR